MESKKALVMYSGGLDSFLSAIKLLQSGYNVDLISFDNGSTIGIEREFFIEAQRIIDDYGSDRVRHVGVYSVWATKHSLSQHFKYSSPRELFDNYPDLPYYQLECLCCHSAMYVYAIAYCKAHGIPVLAEGARIDQGFIVEIPQMLEVYRSICNKHGIDLQLPVLNIKSDFDRAVELSHYNFVPKAYEPQCTLGTAINKSLTHDEIIDLVNYFTDYIKELVDKGIEEMEPILRVVKPKLSMS